MLLCFFPGALLQLLQHLLLLLQLLFHLLAVLEQGRDAGLKLLSLRAVCL